MNTVQARLLQILS